MKLTLFPFQDIALQKLRANVAKARFDYQDDATPQVVSYTAPTGAGKTVIMASLIEQIFRGTAEFPEQPNAIFVWLSDSPELNQQSRDKIDLKSDYISLTQTETISEDSFSEEILADGKIYFLNTQKLGKNCILTRHSDMRQWTIWETLANTVRDKGNRLYFIIDEAHRGMHGNNAAIATTIMQKFLKGSPQDSLPVMPLVIGITATPERFNRLVDGLGSTTIRKVVTTADEVRQSGLLKDRIIIEYPDMLNNEMAVLQAATDEWMDKCVHWEQYCREQHYSYVDPVFVIQVQNGSGNELSKTDLDACLKTIEERANLRFNEGEVVHTFGQTVQSIIMGGLNVPYVEPSRIAENRTIKVVFFKENLSTGWDCPRAETMMSFRKAEDATYIAQLLGRMVRTPKQMRIQVDESLNEVRLFLPYFNAETVKDVVEYLQSAEGSTIPTEVVGEEMGNKTIETWSVKKVQKTIVKSVINNTEPAIKQAAEAQKPEISKMPIASMQQVKMPIEVTTSSNSEIEDVVQLPDNNPVLRTYSTNISESRDSCMSGAEIEREISSQIGSAEEEIINEVVIDREYVIKAINQIGLLTYDVRSTRIKNYLTSLFDLSRLLSITKLDEDCANIVRDEVIDFIYAYIEKLKVSGQYEAYAQKVKSFKMNIQAIDVFGNDVKEYDMDDIFSTTELDIDRQLRQAEMKLGNEGISNRYIYKYGDISDLNAVKIDIILFAVDTNELQSLEDYAKVRFHNLVDNFRIKSIGLSEKYKKDYDAIVSNGDIVSQHNFELPYSITVNGDKNGENYPNHLFVNADGEAWIKLNKWEQGVIEEESQRPDFVCWIRNIPRKPWALTIPYDMDNKKCPAYPDFIIIRNNGVGGYIIDVLEPHDPTRNDNLPKAKGFATYASKNPAVGRLQLIRVTKDIAGEHFKRLDLTKSLVQQKVLAAMTNEELNTIFDTDGEYLN
jgi:type III restriction enzyme